MICTPKRVHIIRTCTQKRPNGYISSERVPKNAKTGTYHQNCIFKEILKILMPQG